MTGSSFPAEARSLRFTANLDRKVFSLLFAIIVISFLSGGYAVIAVRPLGQTAIHQMIFLSGKD
jgi:hypothetical protein